MNLTQLHNELKQKYAFGEFINRYPDAYLGAGFFILDFEKKTENLQFDYYIPSLKKVAGFEYPFKEFKVFEDAMEAMHPLDLEVAVDLEELKSFCDEVIYQNNAAMSINKIIAVLKNNEWNLTCMDSMLGIIRIKADAKTKKVNHFSKGSVLDMARTIKKK